MKKFHVAFLLFFFSFNSHSQFWVNNNASWSFSFNSDGLNSSFGDVFFNDVGDTLLDGRNSDIIVQTKNSWYLSSNIGYFTGNTAIDSNFVSISGDTIFYFQNGQFRTLLNFNSVVGEEWLVHVDTSPSTCDDSCVVVVTEKGILNVQGIDYRFIRLETIGNPSYRFEGFFIERFGKFSDIGSVDFTRSSLFPFKNCISDFETTYFSLNCFEDDLLSYQVFSECYIDPLLSQMETLKIETSTIYPNPFFDKINIETNEKVLKIELINSIGNALQVFTSIEEFENYNLKGLKKGVYYLNIQYSNFNETVKILKCM